MSVEATLDLGETMTEQRLREGLQKLHPDLQFDPAGRLGYYHPNIGKRQGVYLGHKHLAAMQKEGSIPEYNVWALVRNKDNSVRRSHIEVVGWRHTLEKIARARIPGLGWQDFCREFRIDYKKFCGDPSEIEVK